MSYTTALIAIYILTSIWFSIGQASSFPNVYPRLVRLESTNPHDDVGNPLFLTPYIMNNEIQKAQELSRVSITAKLGFRSHSGFITINKEYDSNMFFWYFPSFSKRKDSPVVVWLQGGPGASSLFGLFTENGPLVAQEDGLDTRKYHWALNNNLIYIDNPVGTGFSFTKDKKGHCADEDCVASGLYTFLQQFFTLFPDLKGNDLYITGESYAGKYVPYLGMEIHKLNKKEKSKMNLKGMAIGNGYCDPVNQMDYGSYLYELGLLDEIQYNMFKDLQKQIKESIKNKDWITAGLQVDKLMDGEISKTSYFKNFTGFQYYYNFLIAKDDLDLSVFEKMLKDPELRNSVHVGGLEFDNGEMVRMYLALDLLKSAAPVIADLLSNYRILFYNGQLDIVVAYPLTVNFLQNLNFKSAKDYKKAKRRIWMVDDEVAGYVKRAGNLTEVLVRNAGHMVPHDQPKWALDMITKFINGKF